MADISERDGETLSDEQIVEAERYSWCAVADGGPVPVEAYRRISDQFAALRAQLADARADTERLDWLDAEHERVDPVARLVVKRFHNRNGHQWADCAYSARREIDAARTAVSAPQEERSDG